MAKNKHGANVSVSVIGNNIEKAIRKFSKLTVGIVSEHKKALRYFIKPSAIRHQDNQYKKRQRLVDRGIVVIKTKKK